MCTFNKIFLGKRLVSLCPEEALQGGEASDSCSIPICRGRGWGSELWGEALTPGPLPSLAHSGL